MCSLTDNIYKIEFNEFNIRDMDSGVQLFHVAKDPNMPDIDPAMIPPELEDQVRCIQYDFGSDFLQLRTIGTQLTFSIGPHEVPNFRMIERHYFRNYLIRSFDFTFGFCIPNTTNTWEAIYELPDLEPELIEVTACRSRRHCRRLHRQPDLRLELGGGRAVRNQRKAQGRGAIRREGADGKGCRATARGIAADQRPASPTRRVGGGHAVPSRERRRAARLCSFDMWTLFSVLPATSPPCLTRASPPLTLPEPTLRT